MWPCSIGHSPQISNGLTRLYSSNVSLTDNVVRSEQTAFDGIPFRLSRHCGTLSDVPLAQTAKAIL